MLDIETGKIKDFIKFGVGNLCMVTGGRNCGRVGTVTHQEKHKGSFDVCHVKDATGKHPPPFLLLFLRLRSVIFIATSSNVQLSAGIAVAGKEATIGWACRRSGVI